MVAPVTYATAIVRDMPIPEPQLLKDLLAELAKRLDAAGPQRYAAVVDALRDAHAALDDLEAPVSRDCTGCDGSGTNPHVGGDCIGCHGRGVTA